MKKLGAILAYPFAAVVDFITYTSHLESFRGRHGQYEPYDFSRDLTVKLRRIIRG
jgi:hypothetical protein